MSHIAFPLPKLLGAMNFPHPHGPFGLEHLGQVVAEILGSGVNQRHTIVRPLEFSVETWQRLEALADAASKTARRSVSVSEVASAILQH